MRDKLKQLERIARKLDPGPEDRRAWFRQAGGFAENFLQALRGARTFHRDDGAGAAFTADIGEEGSGFGDLLEIFEQRVAHSGVNPASGGHMGYIPGGGLYPSALGDFLADVTNLFSGVSFASPGGARMEQTLVRWMADLVGFPETAGGDLTSGGSIANLSAIVAAREAQNIGAADVADCCIYFTRQVHHCIDKALRVAGLGSMRRRLVPTDRAFRMNVTELEDLIQADLVQGLRPAIVVASAGTVDTGAVDPLVETSAVARRHGLWLHVDAAYGGFFVLCEEGRAVLRGMNLADSIVMDPHKGLFLPYGSGAVLVREVGWLARGHCYQADYMQDARQDSQGYSPADLSAELSRPFRGLRLWLPLRLFGLEPFRAALSEKIWLARHFHACLSELDGWEVGPGPDLSVVAFRYRPERQDADDFNRRLLQAVHEDGRLFITSTTLNGRFTLRLAVLHFRTHLEQVEGLVELLQEKVRRLIESG